MDADERKRRLESILFPEREGTGSLFRRLEQEVEKLEASVDRPPVAVVPEPENKMDSEEKKQHEEWVAGTRKNALKVGGLMAALSWLGIGGWAGVGCHSCSDSGSAFLGALGFVLVGVISAFLIGTAAATISAWVACMKTAKGFEEATDFFEEVCWDEEEIAVAANIIGVLGILLALGVLVGAIFSIF